MDKLISQAEALYQEMTASCRNNISKEHSLLSLSSPVIRDKTQRRTAPQHTGAFFGYKPPNLQTYADGTSARPGTTLGNLLQNMPTDCHAHGKAADELDADQMVSKAAELRTRAASADLITAPRGWRGVLGTTYSDRVSVQFSTGSDCDSTDGVSMADSDNEASVSPETVTEDTLLNTLFFTTTKPTTLAKPAKVGLEKFHLDMLWCQLCQTVQWNDGL
ncbi:unnamed protein product [Ostreobium quekettii]|uniref:Uncharacterized protein n=1 Tax=Ostreobium quekettii TaxID=121088 RepID=A0A8S1IQD8_9CHLO|nr:unnamed protein product [Ostreobium quekettii]|eukprot:evm.model.scf_38EXC.4 EVM.evm.TU.scf_38EXC.4   scf_38EXC:58290-58946(+)